MISYLTKEGVDFYYNYDDPELGLCIEDMDIEDVVAEYGSFADDIAAMGLISSDRTVGSFGDEYATVSVRLFSEFHPGGFPFLVDYDGKSLILTRDRRECEDCMFVQDCVGTNLNASRPATCWYQPGCPDGFKYRGKRKKELSALTDAEYNALYMLWNAYETEVRENE